jgi:hypothetical protein
MSLIDLASNSCQAMTDVLATSKAAIKVKKRGSITTLSASVIIIFFFAFSIYGTSHPLYSIGI